jgi:hypothetical protein
MANIVGKRVTMASIVGSVLGKPVHRAAAIARGLAADGSAAETGGADEC